ncbi:MAG: hypothetical protein ABSC95_05945 [Acetobacteraceae bacterium]|jgi:hypothetical protein
MDQSPPPHQPDPAIQLQLDIHYRAVDTLRGILPPPLDDTPEAWAMRDRLAVADVASLLPANPVEARLAALHVAAAAYDAHCLRRVPQYMDDPRREAQLMAQAASFGREARGHLNALLRAQAVRKKREANDESRDSAAMAEHCTFGLMTGALERMPPGPPARPAMPPAPPPAAAPAPPPETVRPRDYDEWSEEEKRQDRLRWEADRYAILNTTRVRRIRELGGLPPDCDYEPPRPELLHQIINGDSSNMRWADSYEPYVPAAE